MIIEQVSIIGFRNYKEAIINFNNNTLIIGANDIGKTNLIWALRYLLDRSLSDVDIEPSELDFFSSDKIQSEQIKILIKFIDVKEEAAISILRGNVSDDGESFLQYTASKEDLTYELSIGPSEDNLTKIDSRFYLKYINLRYIASQRDLVSFINREKKKLLKISKQNLTEPQKSEDNTSLANITQQLEEIDKKVGDLNYVKNATNQINEELAKLAYAHKDYNVGLNSSGTEIIEFINKLRLGACNDGSNVMLGGDGRNNQILIALWKVLSTFEHNLDDEVVFYVVEEPEAHLHPHQQRKLAKYLAEEIPTQCLITTHSPHIASSFSPDRIIRLLTKNKTTCAAQNGCNKDLAKVWKELGYRMSIIPADAFFSNGVFMVEGPSEEIFYKALCANTNLDLDYYNISIFAVNGIQFKVFVNVLNALEIPFSLRTDNDISTYTEKETGSKMWCYLGVRRCYGILDQEDKKWAPSSDELTITKILSDPRWNDFEKMINAEGIYISEYDLENDLVTVLEDRVNSILKKDTQQKSIDYLQKSKALHMQELVAKLEGRDFDKLIGSKLAEPIHYLFKTVDPNFNREDQ